MKIDLIIGICSLIVGLVSLLLCVFSLAYTVVINRKTTSILNTINQNLSDYIKQSNKQKNLKMGNIDKNSREESLKKFILDHETESILCRIAPYLIIPEKPNNQTYLFIDKMLIDLKIISKNEFNTLIYNGIVFNKPIKIKIKKSHNSVILKQNNYLLLANNQHAELEIPNVWIVTPKGVNTLIKIIKKNKPIKSQFNDICKWLIENIRNPITFFYNLGLYEKLKQPEVVDGTKYFYKLIYPQKHLNK